MHVVPTLQGYNSGSFSELGKVLLDTKVLGTQLCVTFGSAGLTLSPWYISLDGITLSRAPGAGRRDVT